MQKYRTEIRATLFFALLFMILSRIIWIELRHYPSYETELSAAVRTHLHANGIQCGSNPKKHTNLALAPSYPTRATFMFFSALCQTKHDDLSTTMVRLNRIFLFATVLLAAFVSRFLAGSWLIALLAANIVLSRGALISQLGLVSLEPLMGLAVMMWATCLAHFVRSGSKTSLTIGLSAAVAAATFEPLLWWMIPAPVVVILGGYIVKRLTVWKRSGRSTIAPSAATWNLLTTLTQPVSMWLYAGYRWVKLTALLVVLSFVTAWLISAFSGQHATDPLFDQALVAEQWWRNVLEPVDLHYLLCVIVSFLCLFAPGRRSLPGIVGFSWILFCTMVLALCHVAVLQLIMTSEEPFRWTTSHWTSSRITTWFEPLILTFGFAALYNLTRITGSRLKLNRSLSARTKARYGTD